MYGQKSYGLEQYAYGSVSGGDPAEYYLDLGQYVPPFIAEKLEMNELYQSMGYEAGLVKHSLEDMVDQCFAVSAGWGLLHWERLLGISSNLSLSYERRREIVLARMRGQGTTTTEMIRSAAQAFSGGEVQVEEDNPNYHIIIRFVGILGIPRNMQAFIGMLEEIKPAHLYYTFEYKYVIWEDLRPGKWEDLSVYTWDGLRVDQKADYPAWIYWNSDIWDGCYSQEWNNMKKFREEII